MTRPGEWIKFCCVLYITCGYNFSLPKFFFSYFVNSMWKKWINIKTHNLAARPSCRIPLLPCGKSDTNCVSFFVHCSQECVTSPHVVCNTAMCLFVFPFTCGKDRGGAQCPRRAAPPQQPGRCGWELRQPGRKVCREAPQRCSHRHLHSLCVGPLIQCTHTWPRERAASGGGSVWKEVWVQPRFKGKSVCVLVWERGLRFFFFLINYIL